MYARARCSEGFKQHPPLQHTHTPKPHARAYLMCAFGHAARALKEEAAALLVVVNGQGCPEHAERAHGDERGEQEAVSLRLAAHGG